jgi:hypothetical protein
MKNNENDGIIQINAEDDFEKPKWEICNDEFVIETVKDLIEKYHRPRCNLSHDMFGFLWALKGLPGGSSGVCCKVGDKFKPFFKKPVLFVIIIDFEQWNILEKNQKIALLDHELCHAYAYEDRKGRLKTKLIDHDIEEFNCIVNRHGLWHDGLENFYNSVKK